MNRRIKLKIFLGALVLSVSASNANAGLLDFVKENPTVAAVGGAAAVGMSLNKQSYQKILNDLVDRPEQTNSFFQRSPNYFNPIANLLLKDLAQAKTQEEYSRYCVVADLMGLNGIPPFRGAVTNGPSVYTNPQRNNPTGNVLANPGSPTKFSNIIKNPQGQKINPLMEYPYENIHTWEDYVLAKQNSTILAENMEQAGMGAKPAGYAAHHIVPATAPGADAARKILAGYGIDFNDAENGVYLPTPNAVVANGIIHNGRHPNEYVSAVNQAISDANLRGGKTEVLNELNKIKGILQNAPNTIDWRNVL